MKKEVWILVSVLLAAIVFATPNAVVTLTPISFYETNEADFNLTINNLFGNEVINKITLTMPAVAITDVVDFSGWDENLNGSVITWENGDIETNVFGALFQFSAEAGLVDSNTSIDVDIETEGDSGETNTDTVTIIIVDDTTAPILSNNIPSDGGWLRQGITDQIISVDAVDPETGILNGTFTYWNCSLNATNVTIYNVNLNCVNGTCSYEADLSMYAEGDSMCFEFNVLNNALEQATLNGTVGFDGTAPTVNLISPEDGYVGTGNVNFVFNATDNLALTLDCDLLFELNIEDSIIANNGEATTLSFDVSNLTEGDHDWQIICEDGVGLEGESEERGVLTGVGPEINFSIGMVPRTEVYLINATITDQTGVDNAYFLFENSSTALNKDGDEYTGDLIADLSLPLGDYTIRIIAEDLLGFISNNSYTLTLIQGYDIGLTLDDDSVDEGTEVVINGTIELDNGSEIPEESIILYLINETVEVSIINKTFSYTINATPDGNHIIRAVINDSNGYEHSTSVELEINKVGGGAGTSTTSRRSSGSSRGGYYCGDGFCQSSEDCKSCSSDCGKCPAKPKVEETKTSTGGFNANDDEEPRTPSAGTGAATGWFGRVIGNPLVWLLLLAILGTIYMMGFKKENKPKKTYRPKTVKMDWEGYFNR